MWLYRPVALEDQAKQLLRARQFDAALALADVGAAAGEAWALTVYAEAAFLLLHGAATSHSALHKHLLIFNILPGELSSRSALHAPAC